MKTRTAVLGIVAAALGGIAALVGVVLAGKAGAKGSSPASPEHDAQAGGPYGATAHAEAPRGDEGHAVPDLAAGADVGPGHRAPEAFRPDMDAPMTDAEREALRPATGPAPSLVGASTSQPGVAGG